MMKKIIAGLSALAVMTALSAHVSAVDWSAATYADENPDSGDIISSDADTCTFTQKVGGGDCKMKIKWQDVLENPDDLANVYSGSWKVTYHGLSAFSGTEIGWLGGGTWVSNGNSAGFALAPTEWGEDGMAVWDDEQTVEDSFKWLLGPAEDITNEIVFMDWSGQDLLANNVTVTISDFKIFDKEGNEIAQKTGSGAPAEEVVEEAPAAEEVAVEEAAPAEEAAAPAAEEAPAAAETTTSTATGNTSAAAGAVVMGAAAVAAVASRKRK